MRAFEYSDETISQKELLIALPSMLVATGILTLPKGIAAHTISSDGWIPLLVGGLIVMGIAVCMAKFAAQFAGEPFFSYACRLVTKPIACLFTIGFGVIAMAIAALEIRQIADISKNYIFSRTPVEVIGLSFLLVIVYAVSGSRAGILRLNILFFPITLFIFIFLLLLDIKWFELGNLMPVFQTDFKGYVKAIPTGITSYLGYGIIWFYVSLIQKPKKIGRKVAAVMCIPIGVYLSVYIVCIGVFGNSVTSNLIYPVVELAKEAELPGGILERFESIFFVVWVMAIFNTTAMALDVAVFAFNSLFQHVKKPHIVFILAPIIFITSMTPPNTESVRIYADTVSYIAFSFSLFTLLVFATVWKIRGGKPDG